MNYRQAASSTLGDSQRADTVNEYGGSVIHRLSPTIQVGMNAEYHRRLSGDHLRDYKGLRAGGFITYGVGTR